MLIYLIAFCTCLGGFTFGYDIGVISGVLIAPAFEQLVGVTDANRAILEGNIASALQFGSFPGLLIQPFINDRFGRRAGIFTSGIIFVIGGLLQTCANGLLMMYAGRAVAGLGVGIMMISISILNAELAPTALRGRIIGIQQLMVACGIAAAYWVNYFMVSAEGSFRFRLPLFLQIVPPAILVIGMLFVPESPRWLISKGRHVEARRSLAKIREIDLYDPRIEYEIEQIEAFLGHNDNSSWLQVFERKNLSRLSVGITLLVFQQFGGQNIINYYAPTIFKNIGISGDAASLYATGFVGLLKIVMTLPALWAIDTAGRRPLMLIGTTIMAGAFYYIGIFNSNPNRDYTSFGGSFAIACIYIFMAGYSMSWGVLHYVVPAEVYPQHIRAKAETFSAIFEGAFQILSIITGPILIKALPNGGLYFLFAGLLTFFLVWIFFCLPETKGIPLEKMELAFQNWKRWQKIDLPPPGHLDSVNKIRTLS